MDLAKPSDRRMADRSPCLVLGKSCRGGCGNNGDDDGDEMERAFITEHVAPRRMAAVVAISGRRSDGGDERMLRRVTDIVFLLAGGVLVCVLCDVPDVPLVMVRWWWKDGRMEGWMEAR